MAKQLYLQNGLIRRQDTWYVRDEDAMKILADLMKTRSQELQCLSLKTSRSLDRLGTPSDPSSKGSTISIL